MSSHRCALLVLFAALTLALGACGDDDGDDDDATPTTAAGDETASDSDAPASTSDSGAWVAELEDGSQLRVELDVAADDARVAPFVAFREQAGLTDPVTWIAAEVDVPADVADGQGSGRFLTFVEEGRNPLEDDPEDPTDGVVIADFACGELDEWFAAAATDDLDALNVTYGEVFSETCGGQVLGVPAPPGETTPYVLVVAGEQVPEFAELYAGLAITLSPTG